MVKIEGEAGLPFTPTVDREARACAAFFPTAMTAKEKGDLHGRVDDEGSASRSERWPKSRLGHAAEAAATEARAREAEGKESGVPPVPSP